MKRKQLIALAGGLCLALTGCMGPAVYAGELTETEGMVLEEELEDGFFPEETGSAGREPLEICLWDLEPDWQLPWSC